MSNPCRRASGLMIREVDGEVLVLDTESDKIHKLNTTASFIWHRCDGSVAVEEISEELAEAFGIGQDIARKDVLDAVKALEALNLIEEA